MGSKVERQAGKRPKQQEAWLPQILAGFNLPRTRELVPELAISPDVKIKQAIKLFEKLASCDKDKIIGPSRQWSLEYFQACAKGSNARRDFLIEEGVFYGEDGVYLYCPDRVKSGMEIVNCNPEDYPDYLKGDIKKMKSLMFAEYFGVKNLLSFPDRADIISWLSTWISPLKHIRLAEPELKPSLLLEEYVKRTRDEAKKSSGSPLVAIFGPGKGEELVPLTRKGFSVLCLDAHDEATLQYLFETTFDQAKEEKPRIEPIGQGANVDTTPFAVWEEEGCKPTIFICSEIDFGREGAIPKELFKISRVAASIYVLHEMPLEQKASLVKNMAFVSKNSVVIIDGNPSIKALDNIILPVSDRAGAQITGHDAAITYMRCLSPKEMKKEVRKGSPHLSWEVEIVGPNIPPPLFHKLQISAIGRLS